MPPKDKADTEYDPASGVPPQPGWQPPRGRDRGGAPPAAPRHERVRFSRPEQLGGEFGVVADTGARVQGYVETRDVRKLLDAFGLQDRTEVTFPFQAMETQRGEILVLRIEPLSTHSIEGDIEQAHAWMFSQVRAGDAAESH